jgi:hypothetical protein
MLAQHFFNHPVSPAGPNHVQAHDCTVVPDPCPS